MLRVFFLRRNISTTNSPRICVCNNSRIVVLLAFGLNRLILAALSAGLPLIVENHSLISANAMAVTGGSIFVVIGGGLGLGLRKIFDSFHNANHSDASMILIATIGYCLTSLLILRIGK